MSRTARLMRSGRAKIAKKMAEEAVEVVVDVMRGDREAAVRESADLLYHLVVLWADAGIRPQDVWAEMDRRERLLGIAEKPPKALPMEPVTAAPAGAAKSRRSGSPAAFPSRAVPAIDPAPLLRAIRAAPNSRLTRPKLTFRLGGRSIDRITHAPTDV